MEPEKFEIFYIRHADTSHAGHADRDKCDVGLSETGEKQILLLAERFRGQKFDAVLSSPLYRAVKTAAAVAKVLEGDPAIEIIPCLAENNTVTGGYPGADPAVLGELWHSLTFNREDIFGKNGVYPDGTEEDNTARAKAVAAYLKKRFTFGQRILVFSHGSFGNSFIPAAVGFDEGEFILSVNNTSVSKIKYTSDGKTRLSFMNDMSHLRPIMPDYESDV